MSVTKSRVWFSPRTPRRIKEQLVGILGLPTIDRIGTYLGTPIFTTRRTASLYQYLVENIRKRIEGWQTKYLLMVGRATLIKASITSIPTYAMQTTLLPQKICHHIDKLSRNFLWGGSEHHRSCHTVSWDTVTLPKEARGLGIPSTSHRNHAILMNQGWHLFSNPTSLWAQVRQAKYFPYDTLFTSPQTSQGFHIWTAISIGANLLRLGMRWYIGDGQTIRIWRDPWLPNGTLRSYIEGPLPPHEEDQRINALWINHSWSLDSLSIHLPPQLHKLIQGIPMARFAQLRIPFSGHIIRAPAQ